MNLQNNARKFNTIMPKVNHSWAAHVLNMQINENSGPDLIDDDKFVELKFTLIPNSKNYVGWIAFEHQLNYNQRPIGFWGVGTYQLKKQVADIVSPSIEELEELVKYRELFLVGWDWARTFQVHPSKGEPNTSEWNYIRRYLKHNQLPKIIQSCPIEKGIVHLTENVPIEMFRYLG